MAPRVFCLSILCASTFMSVCASDSPCSFHFLLSFPFYSPPMITNNDHELSTDVMMTYDPISFLSRPTYVIIMNVRYDKDVI